MSGPAGPHRRYDSLPAFYINIYDPAALHAYLDPWNISQAKKIDIFVIIYAISSSGGNGMRSGRPFHVLSAAASICMEICYWDCEELPRTTMMMVVVHRIRTSLTLTTNNRIE